jgi:hypothetical protein
MVVTTAYSFSFIHLSEAQNPRKSLFNTERKIKEGVKLEEVGVLMVFVNRTSSVLRILKYTQKLYSRYINQEDHLEKIQALSITGAPGIGSL